MTASDALTDLFSYPLLEAIFGRRSRRFGLGIEIPSGPLKFTSKADPLPLSELEQRTDEGCSRLTVPPPCAWLSRSATWAPLQRPPNLVPWP